MYIYICIYLYIYIYIYIYLYICNVYWKKPKYNYNPYHINTCLSILSIVCVLYLFLLFLNRYYIFICIYNLLV